MRTLLVSLSVAAVVVVAPSCPRVRSDTAARPAAAAVHAAAATLLGQRPVAFVPNLGQWEHQASHVARLGPMTVFLQEKGWTLTLVERAQREQRECAPRRQGDDRASAAREPTLPSGRGAALAMTFVGADDPELVVEDRLPGHHNYFLGSDPARWRTDVPLYGAVCYRNLYPGIDVRVHTHDGHFEFDLVLAPDAALERVEIAVDGIEAMHLEGDTLVLDTASGPARMPAPKTWQEGPGGKRCPVACEYSLRSDRRFGFAVPQRDPDCALVVDPGIVWSTFVGASGAEEAYALALDAQAAPTLAGWTSSATFPTTLGAFDTTYNGGSLLFGDAFVTRLSPSGATLVYSTFLGGQSNEGATALALDPQGAAIVGGRTESTNFPTTAGAFSTTYNGGTSDAFVTVISPSGSSLVYSTFLGGAADESVAAVTVDASGAVIVGGYTESTGFPTTPGAYDSTYNGGGDAFLTRVSPSGASLESSTFLGGADSDSVGGVTVDGRGVVTMVGSTTSADFPTTAGAYDTTYDGALDAVVARLSDSNLIYSTYLGGTNFDRADALAIDAQGAITVCGVTSSTDFPTTPGAFDTTANGDYDAFVTRLSPSGSNLVFSTFLGGAGSDGAYALALDLRGAATVGGGTSSADFPATPGAFDVTHNGLSDGYVARLSPSGSRLEYATFLGGSEPEWVYALAVDAEGVATVAGSTSSSAFPTTAGAFDTTYNGGFIAGDAFAARLDMLPTGASVFGRSSAGCTGRLAISVTSMPRAGSADFALTCSNAPANACACVGLAAAALSTPLRFLGVDIWFDASAVWFVALPGQSNSLGAAEIPLPIPQDPWLVGQRLYAQFVWAGPASPPPCPPLGLSASNALEVLVQP